MSASAIGPVQRTSKPVRFLAVVAIFVLLGPPVGGLAVWIAVAADAIWSGKTMSLVLESFRIIVGFSYFAGFFFALVAGAVVAAAGLWWRRNSILVPVAAAIVATVSVMLAFLLLASPTSSLHNEPEKVALSYLAISLVASVVCWWVTRKLVRSSWASAS